MEFRDILILILSVIEMFIIVAFGAENISLEKKNEELRKRLRQEESGEDSDNDVFFNDFRKND